MRSDERAASWGRLSALGLVSGELGEERGAEDPYGRIVLGASAWIATLCILSGAGCLFGFCMQEVVGLWGLAVFGLVLLGAAFSAYSVGGHSVFGRQLGQSLSVSGQGLLLSGVGAVLHEHLDVDSPRALAVLMGLFAMLMYAALIALFKDRAHRALCATLGTFALMGALWGLRIEAMTGALVLGAWLGLYAWERRLLAWHEALVVPVRWGLAVGLVAPLCWLYALRLGVAANLDVVPALVWAGECALVAVSLVALWRWRPRAGAKPAWLVPAALLSSPLAVFAPGLSAALALVVVGFERRERRVMLLGLVALCCSLGSYYYALALTLKVKALILMALGAALLIARRVALGAEEGRDA
jgi:hypothetical protein